MKLVLNPATLCLLIAPTASAFAPMRITTPARPAAFSRGASALNALIPDDAQLVRDLDKQLAYIPGAADGELARRFGDLSGKDVKTVGEAFTDFTQVLGHAINPLYKSGLTDIVGSTHLTVVDARFKRDAIWSLGLLTTMETLLKNYPEKEVAKEIISALIKSIGFDETVIRQEAAAVIEGTQGLTKDAITAAMRGEGESLLASIAKSAKDDEFWMYSRFFGIGLLRVMDKVGVEMSPEATYTVMEEWMGKSLGKSFFTACSDADLWFRTKSKLDMMETLMKEIEIREKKRMAERLEERAEVALKQAERDTQMQREETLELV